MYKHFFKRVIDFTIANKGAGAFFFQERLGLQGKIFKVIKFKTMTDERDAEGKLLPDADRLTKVGRFVRSTSIDELPQLINVLKGDMALIGPRPLLPQYLPLYSKEQMRRHEVRPGISGWAQCHQLDREVQARCVVCGPLLAPYRPESNFHHHQESACA